MSYQVLTRKDYDFFECSSAFQKSIRRCEEKDSLFFGMELAASGYAKYLWKRMMIIASEDVGLAEPMMAVQIQALYQNWIVISGSSSDEGSIPITHAILLLARGKKSRLVDNAKMFALKNKYNPEIPDYALDTHTRRGKKMGRGLKFFQAVGSIVVNDPGLPDPLNHQQFMDDYLHDHQDKKVDHTGYDRKNIWHKNPKEMQVWKDSRKAEGTLFDS